MVVIVISSETRIGRAVRTDSVDSVEGVGEVGGGVGDDDDEVRESVSPGDDPEDEMIEGVRSDEGEDGSDDQPGAGAGITISSSSVPTRLNSSE